MSVIASESENTLMCAKVNISIGEETVKIKDNIGIWNFLLNCELKLLFFV